MANTQTSVPAFTAGQVLTAQQQTEINTGIPVFATTTTRDAAFGGTGEKTLAEGQFAYIEASNTTQYYDGAAWQTVGGGLTLIKAQTIGSAVSSVTVSDVFSATYDSYRIIVSGGGAASAGIVSRFTLGASATSYVGSGVEISNTGSAGGFTMGTTYLGYVTSATTNNHNGVIDLLDPYLTQRTTVIASTYAISSGYARIMVGYHDSATSFTAFTLTASSGTFTGGTIRVYGYQNS